MADFLPQSRKARAPGLGKQQESARYPAGVVAAGVVTSGGVAAGGVAAGATGRRFGIGAWPGEGGTASPAGATGVPGGGGRFIIAPVIGMK